MAAKASAKSGSSSGNAPRQPQRSDSGLALDKLSAAFEQMLSSGSDPYSASAGGDAIVVEEESAQVSPGEPPPQVDEQPEASDDACEITPRSILEAMLFVGSPSSEPLTSQQ